MSSFDIVLTFSYAQFFHLFALPFLHHFKPRMSQIENVEGQINLGFFLMQGGVVVQICGHQTAATGRAHQDYYAEGLLEVVPVRSVLLQRNMFL